MNQSTFLEVVCTTYVAGSPLVEELVVEHRQLQLSIVSTQLIIKTN
jgi:hypothetical protein